jgi:hypothetical protein
MQSNGRFTPLLRRLVHYHHDICSKCGEPLQRGIAAFAGYGTDGSELYVGECCKSEIRELASHVYWWWLSYKRPTPDTPLWRFMDFAKFVALLSDKAIYFPRADLLGDPFEGARGIVSRRGEWKDYTMKYYRELIANPPPPHKNTKTEEEIEAEALKLHDDVERLSAREVKEQFVTCWHSNEVESEALWRLYCPALTPGVCIKTTFGLLDKSLHSDYEIRFGHVQYIDFKKDFAGTYDRIFWKRKSLSHEAEVRGVIHPEPDGPDGGEAKGMLVKTDLKTFIQSVIVSPLAVPWFQDVLKRTLEKFQVDLPVTASDLTTEPFY